MSNFQFISSEWPSLFNSLEKAEKRAIIEPISSVRYQRYALEELLYCVFDYEHVELPFNKDIYNLLRQDLIKDIVPHKLLAGLDVARITGNRGAHYGNKVNGDDALVALKYIYSFTKWFANNYSQETDIDLPGVFNDTAVPDKEISSSAKKEIQNQLENEKNELLRKIKELESKNEQVQEKLKESESFRDKFLEQQKQKQVEIAKQRKERLKEIPSEFNEKETRKHIIDANLAEAGWSNLKPGYNIEYPVQHMPISADNPKGNGFVDYVLWGDDGLPLAIVEAKKTSTKAENGRHQASLYANSLEKMTGRRPVIFYSNGYTNYILDDTFYSAPRIVHGFYSKHDLERLILRRSKRKDIRKAEVNLAITDRPYQLHAIRRVAEAFATDSGNTYRGSKRAALLVMATGSGKTRTAASLVEVLCENNWAKHILFLADRTPLVRQAKSRFGEFLPDYSSSNLLEDKEDDSVRLVFSTYQTMINRMDSVFEDNHRFYGVGHFDLIILDEAHRSIYNKYKTIFEYFDALIVGLTATPKKGIHHNTYEVFECPKDDPTFYFGLEEATPKYLVPYKPYTINTSFVRGGIKYKDLTPEQQEVYENTFANEEGIIPDQVTPKEMLQKLFNKDTVKKVLKGFMDNGLKIEGNDKIGRTIIFASNQNHAEFIVQCFHEFYPHYPSDFIALVHNQVSHAQSIIDKFCDEKKENMPQIVVSVDMMDTGIDAPRILNLVFFKVVRSYAKFWQMIGRGTRLCPDIFGPGKDKTEFRIFDVCGNFESFEKKPEGIEYTKTKSLTQHIIEAKLDLIIALRKNGDDDFLSKANDLTDELYNWFEKINTKSIGAKLVIETIDKFSNRDRWNNLSASDIALLKKDISPIMFPDPSSEEQRRFDLMILRMQLVNISKDNVHPSSVEKLIKIADSLSEKYSVPKVREAKELIEKLKDERYYNHISIKKLDEINNVIRELLDALDQDDKKTIYYNIEDTDAEVIEFEGNAHEAGNVSPEIYRQRVERFVRENKHHITIHKLNTNIPITKAEVDVLENILFDGEERGTKEDFKRVFKSAPLGTFIRQIVGLDRLASERAFAELINQSQMSADQITFIRHIIDFLEVNGIIDPDMLFEPPFTDMNDQGVVGLFDQGDAHKIIDIIKGINHNANIG